MGHQKPKHVGIRAMPAHLGQQRYLRRGEERDVMHAWPKETGGDQIGIPLHFRELKKERQVHGTVRLSGIPNPCSSAGAWAGIHPGHHPRNCHWSSHHAAGPILWPNRNCNSPNTVKRRGTVCKTCKPAYCSPCYYSFKSHSNNFP